MSQNNNSSISQQKEHDCCSQGLILSTAHEAIDADYEPTPCSCPCHMSDEERQAMRKHERIWSINKVYKELNLYNDLIETLVLPLALEHLSKDKEKKPNTLKESVDFFKKNVYFALKRAKQKQ